MKRCCPEISEAVGGNFVKFREIEEKGKGGSIAREVKISGYAKRFGYVESRVTKEVKDEGGNKRGHRESLEELMNVGGVVANGLEGNILYVGVIGRVATEERNRGETMEGDRREGRGNRGDIRGSKAAIYGVSWRENSYRERRVVC